MANKTESKKNIEKLKIFLAKQSNDIKASNKKIGGDSTSTPTN
jgi:hypothetical protein